MKKLSIERKIWLINHQKRIERRRSGKIFQVKYNRKTIEEVSIINNDNKDFITRLQNGRFNIDLPKELNFTDNYEQTVSTLECIRKASRKQIQLKYLSFEKIDTISISAALVLTAEIDRWIHFNQGKISADVENWSPTIKRLLFQLGYLDLLKLETDIQFKDDQVDSDCSIVFMPFLKGNKSSDCDGGTLAKKLREKIEAITKVRIKRHFLFEGLSEALTNVSHHAYRSYDAFRNWWMTASYNFQTKELKIVFYDQGVGIPETLPTSKYFERVKDLFDRFTDSDKINAAMKQGRSSTEKIERGKGLQNFLELIDSYNIGELKIFSNRGLCKVESIGISEDAIVTTSTYDHNNKINGTLIEWSIVL
jgi:hypothetical protein